jgi:hypothetical protein
LAELLAKLKTQPLVQDPDVRTLHELNLDIHDRWIGDEARNYTPWPRHDELQRPEAEKILHKWSKEAISAFSQGIKAALDQEERLKEVSSLRQELIELWILSGSRMAGVKSAHVLDDLRDTMNNQLETIVSSRAQGLQDVVSDVTQVLGKWSFRDDEHYVSLWTAASSSPDLGNGAQLYKSTILNTYQGRDEAVIHIVSTFDKWMESVLEVKGIVKSMKETRWDDTFADDVDDSDDELGLDSKQSLLSDDDPRLLEEVTQEALGEALESLGKSFAQIVSKLTSGHEKSFSASRMIFVLRVVREIGDRIPRLRLQDRYKPPPSPFSSDILRPLHSALARQIVIPSVEGYGKSLATAGKSRSRSHILWEGNPALPTQPSPSAFRFLQGLVRSMGARGSDIWAPDGVSVLKALTRTEVSKIWQQNFEAISQFEAKPEVVQEDQDAEAAAESEGETQDPPSAKPWPHAEELRTKQLKQFLFDILYVQRYLGEGSGELVEGLYRAVGADEGLKARLNRNAAEYGRKTYMVFALLA